MHVKLFAQYPILSSVTVFPGVRRVDSGEDTKDIGRDQTALDLLCHSAHLRLHIKDNREALE